VGFVNDQDYINDDSRPLIAVIGDSYIEALMVSYNETLQGRLAEHMKEKGRVYSFGFSGAPLSQYLAWVKYANETYQPDAIIINIAGNDFDESLAEYRKRAGYHFYFKSNDNSLNLELIDYEPGRLSYIARRSSLAQYLIYNLNIMHTINKSEKIAYVGNTLANADSLRIEKSKEMLSYFFDDLVEMSQLPPEKIIFTIDGIRQQIYNQSPRSRYKKSYFYIMREYFIKEAINRNFQVIDLHTYFENDFLINNKIFEFKNDNHWSGYGHKIVFEAITESNWFKEVIKNDF
jgi:hypothetical protein